MQQHGSLLPRNLRNFAALLHARPPYIEINSRDPGGGPDQPDADSTLLALSQVPIAHS